MKVWTDVKINLGLSVLRKRPDGFHDLETLFVPYAGFGDSLEIVSSGLLPEDCPDSLPGHGCKGQANRTVPRAAAAADDVQIEISNCDWDPMEDLTVKAYRLLKADFPEIPAVSIRLEKHAPVGAGLGGGSADAAYALKMMDSMFGLGLGTERLAEYAARLGSDCAFFIYDRPMFGTGRGEVLEPYELDLGAWEIRVEIPDGPGVSTREAYGGIVPRERREEGLLPLREALARPVEQWRDVLVNDFERTVFPLHPEIAALKEKMYADGAVYAAMSGSGSSVFGLFAK